MKRSRRLFAVPLVLTAVLASCGGPSRSEEPSGTAHVTGTVVDATTGRPVARALACFVYRGHVTSVCDSTSNTGEFQLQNLPEGDQAVEVSKAGFASARESVRLVGGTTATLQITLNPQLSSGEYRVVLTWGENPSDLDSHLWVPQRAGYYEVFYPSNSRGDCSGPPYACLDVDDTTSFGPETVTIAQLQSGTYRYAVHWFAGAGSWAGSRAVVKVYDAGGLIASYTAPANSSEPGAGSLRWWYVFDLEGGTLLPKNTLSTNPPLPSSTSLLRVK
ncbi:MAG TPA: hypothetical protein ENK37_04000 [Oceanithermus profundus]|uniref:Carboxypeptidase regulatory-like domain-containing protein n=1 Tax=Oceanithermus profundus TaxID=187137 RepID=A0A7C4V5B2_9DEIN|nr:hypothetical protein [Oceanithermus profundus]